MKNWCPTVLALLSGLATARSDEPSYDVVVYGGTAAGVIAAVQTARMGHSVVLLEPTQHLGGLTSSGLGMTDAGRKEVIGGLAREIYQRMRKVGPGILPNDPTVPADLHAEVNKWGLAKDEFPATGGWPHAIYIREARRMVSDWVHSEADCRRTRTTPQPVGMGSYNMDSHNVQRYVDPRGFARNEGDIQAAPGAPYPISYLSLRPKAAECTNLLVPVCCAASHIAYGSVRMEPVFMVLAQSAATAACLSLDAGTTVQDVTYDALRTRLLADGQVLEWK